MHKQAHNRFGTLQTDTGRRGALASTKTDLGPSRQTHIDEVHRQAHNRFGTLQTDTGRCGALASTKNRFGTLQADTHRRGALVSTETDLGPSRQTQIDVVH